MFHTDDYWEGNDYDCPNDLPDYLRYESRKSFHTDDCDDDDMFCGERLCLKYKGVWKEVKDNEN